MNIEVALIYAHSNYFAELKPIDELQNLHQNSNQDEIDFPHKSFPTSYILIKKLNQRHKVMNQFIMAAE